MSGAALDAVAGPSWAAVQAGTPAESALEVHVTLPSGDAEAYPDYPFGEIPHGKQSWYGPLGGIWQSVKLLARGKRHVAHVAIDANPDVYKPTLSDAYVTVATRYQQQGDTQQYIDFLGKAVEVNPLSASLHLALGDAHWLAGQRAGAIAQYKLVLELEPEHSQRVRLLNRIRARADAAAES